MKVKKSDTDLTCQFLPEYPAWWLSDDGEDEFTDKNLSDFDGSSYCECSNCGQLMLSESDGWFDAQKEEHGIRYIPRFNYCPNCGARVVIPDAK